MANILEIIVKLNDQASPQAKTLSSNLKNIGTTMAAVGGVMTATLTAPILGGLTKAIFAASNFEESLSKTRAVFGPLSGEIERWAAGSARSFGISNEVALAVVSTYGDMFQAMGLTAKMSQNLSVETVELASDLASFHNMKPEEVHEKLRAAYTGEYESLKSLGIVLSDTLVKETALMMTGKESADQLTQTELVLARQKLILEATARAQGDFARTSEGLANQQRILKAELANIAVELGQVLLPLVTDLVPILRSIVQWFANLPEPVQKTVVVVGLLAAAIGPVLVVVGSLITALGAVLPVLSGLGGAIGAVVGVIGGPLIGILVAAAAVLGVFYLAWKNNWGGMRDFLNTTSAQIDATLKGMTAKASQNLSTFGTRVRADWTKLWTDVRSFFGTALDGIKNKWLADGNALRTFWTNLLTAVRSFTQASLDAVRTTFTTVLNAVRSAVAAALTAVRTAWTTGLQNVQATTGAIWNTIRSLFGAALAGIGAAVRAFTALLRGDWQAFASALQAIAGTLWNVLRGVFSGGVSAVLSIIRGGVSGIVSAFTGVNWGSVGAGIIGGIARGISGAIGGLVNSAVSAALAAYNAAKRALGIRSPSRLFENLGRDTIAGFIRGMRVLNPNLAAAAAGSVQSTTIETKFYVTANYPYQSYRNLRSDLQQLNALYGRGRV